MAGPPSGSRTGRPGYGAGGTDQRRFQRQLTVLKGYAALAADRGERPPPAAGGPAGAGRAGDPGRSLVRPGGGGGGPTRHPGGLLQRVRRPAGALPLWRRAWHAGWAAPGRSCWTMSRRSGGRRGPGREGGALPDPAQLDGPGDGELLLLRRV